VSGLGSQGAVQEIEILCRSCEQRTGDNMCVGAVCIEAGSRV